MGGYWQHLQAVSRLSIAAGLILASSPAVLACGYHDDVSMARGMMNWVYPDALHVLGAISTAVAEQRLPASVNNTAPDLFGSRYRRTAEALGRFGEALGESTDRMPALSFSIVLLEPMLWTRYEAAGVGLRTEVHVTGPEASDLVLVSGEAVIGEMAAGRLATGEAIERGLIRLYGSESQKAAFIGAFRSAGSARPGTIKSTAMSGHAAQSVAGMEAAMHLQSVSITARPTLPSTAFEADGALACGPGHH
ncbi:hypothetical protein PZN02_002760 [Sinorhizobium garamanticum]|uniref:Lipoprotein n=1 Tax=Sinorhizobium garamanticum TaxID=680247 RepID=A0ABY8D6H3_9HYPH|nr:hypothetical protein [Sinorhizobium garamanticum]WEX86475.1 hypothetical protein PZN02_002760 [Sinorhizobium garamanticum]